MKHMEKTTVRVIRLLKALAHFNNFHNNVAKKSLLQTLPINKSVEKHCCMQL